MVRLVAGHARDAHSTHTRGYTPEQCGTDDPRQPARYLPLPSPLSQRGAQPSHCRGDLARRCFPRHAQRLGERSGDRAADEGSEASSLRARRIGRRGGTVSRRRHPCAAPCTPSHPLTGRSFSSTGARTLQISMHLAVRESAYFSRGPSACNHQGSLKTKKGESKAKALACVELFRQAKLQLRRQVFRQAN
eukprot:3720289-Pleurochrysis_carterae.AAC.3